MKWETSLVCLVLLAVSCAPPAELGGDAANLAAEPEFDAWVSLGPGGEVLDRGKELLAPPPPAALAGRRQALAAGPAAVSREIAALLDGGDDDVEIEVVLAVRSARRLTRLPPLIRDLPRDAPENREILAERRRLQAADDDVRAAERAPVAAAIAALGGRVTGQGLAGNTLRATISAGALRGLLAARADIAAVAPALTDALPAASDWPHIADGRDYMQTDEFVDFGYDGAYYYLGLLDTGLYAAHTVFKNPDHVLFWRDCWGTPNADCTKYNLYPWYLYWDPDDTYDTYPGGHGTGNANIVVGNSNLGDTSRGVAPGAYLDSVNVYYDTHHNTASTDATLRAFDFLDGYDDVILAEVAIDDSGMEEGTLALAADDLYDAGVTVIAPVGTVTGYARSPSVAHKVIGVGPFIATTGDIEIYANGSSDDRIKPDILGASTMQVAGTGSGTELVNRNGTCPAAASVAAAALLLKDFYQAQGFSSDPGAIYAALITFGDRWGSQMSDGYGAGRLVLGQIGWSRWYTGVRYVDPGQSATATFWVPAGACDLRAGIWWAEEASENHQAVSLRLFKGSTEYAYSGLGMSVFQKVARYSLSEGYWYLKISGGIFNTRQDVTVHYLVHFRTGC